jgi:hypothetical protein
MSSISTQATTFPPLPCADSRESHPFLQPSNYDNTNPSISLLDLLHHIKKSIILQLDRPSIHTLAHTSSALQELAEPHIWSYYNLDPRRRESGDPALGPEHIEVVMTTYPNDPVQLLSGIMDNMIGEDHGCLKLWSILRLNNLQSAIKARPERARGM